MKMQLDNLTHPEVDILNFDVEHKRVIFKNQDGVNFAPYEDVEVDLPTAKIKTAVEAKLGELQAKAISK